VIDPWEIINEYGTDAFRWALLADSAPWNSKRFSRGIVGEAKSKVIDTIVNTHAFYALYASIDGFVAEAHEQQQSANKLDRWIVSRLNSLIGLVNKGLASNDFLNPAKAIELFVDEPDAALCAAYAVALDCAICAAACRGCIRQPGRHGQCSSGRLSAS
jgi:isoleucyl-tRNA synthetase